ADVAIFADVGGKHAVPLGPVELDQTARDLVHRGLADALVVSGPATGQATPLADVKRVRSAVSDVPLLVGSGVTAETIAELLSLADGVIVGTSVKRHGDVRLPVERARVEKLVAAAPRPQPSPRRPPPRRPRGRPRTRPPSRRDRARAGLALPRRLSRNGGGRERGSDQAPLRAPRRRRAAPGPQHR